MIILSVPGTDLSIVWPHEYAILVAWLVLGAVTYMATRGESEENALRSLAGEHYEKLGRGSRGSGPKM